MFDNVISEVITSTGSAESVAGAKYFKTVTAVVCSAQYAGNITVGSTASAAQAIGGGGRLRLKGLSVVSGGTAGIVDYYDGSPESGTVLFKSRTIGTDNTTLDNTIPDQGLLFKDGCFVTFTVGTIDMMNFFHA